VIAALGEAHPLGAGFWGFNHDDDGRGYVQGEAVLDIAAVVRGAVADPEGIEEAG
jgi:hypothetical protein